MHVLEIFTASESPIIISRPY